MKVIYLKIAHIVTLITPEGTYGGPVRVALNLAREQIIQGHEVVVYGSYSGFVKPPKFMAGVPVKLFKSINLVPNSGFAGTFSSKLLVNLTRELSDSDIVHIHMARDLVTLPSALIALILRKKYFLQTHGMVDPSKNILSRPLDLFLTRKILRTAQAVFYLTELERKQLLAVARRGISTAQLINGVPKQSYKTKDKKRSLEILFLARLAKRKRPVLFAKLAQELIGEYAQVDFRLVGPDEGEGPQIEAITKLVGSERLVWEGPIQPEMTLERMKSASIYVLPSVAEPFPMSVLEAMSIGLPVIITDSCGLSPAVKEADAGIVVDESPESLKSAIQLLIENEAVRDRISQNALKMVQENFSMSAIVSTLMKHYENALAEEMGSN